MEVSHGTTLRDPMEGDLLLKGLAEVTRAEYLRHSARRPLPALARRARCRRPIATHDGGQPFAEQFAIAGVAKDGLALVPARRDVVAGPRGSENVHRPSHATILPGFKT